MPPYEKLASGTQIPDVIKNLTLEKLVKVVKDANALYDQGQYEESIWWYDQAISINPTNIGVLYNKANVMVKLGKYDEALEQLDAVQATKTNRAAGGLTALDNYRLSAEQTQLQQQLEIQRKMIANRRAGR